MSIASEKADDVRAELKATEGTGSTKAKMTKAESAAVLRARGASVAEIRVALEYDTDVQVRHDIEKVLADSLDNYDREKLRELMDSRLEMLWRMAYKRAADDRNPYRHQAEKQALAVANRIIEMHGLDAPKELRLHAAADSEINQWIEHIRQGGSMPALPQEADIIDVEPEEDDTQ